MSWATAVVLIVLVSAIAGVMRSRYRAPHGTIAEKNAAEHPVTSGRERELESEVAELRERLKVLERIATSDREAKAISSEIEALRDIEPSPEKR